MKLGKSLGQFYVNVFARRTSILSIGGLRFNSVCVSLTLQKLAVPRLQQSVQSVPLSTTFRVNNRHFSLTSDDSSSNLPVFDSDSKLVLKNGQPFTGCGEVNFPLGTYSGDFVDGKRHGHGVLKNANGNIYEGEWKDNHKDGDGIFTDAEGKIISQGLFKEGSIFTGKGLLKPRFGCIYEGEVLEGQRHGQGKLTTKTGMVWEGEFRLNVPFNGKGCFRNKQGVWVEGVFTAEKKMATTDTSSKNRGIKVGRKPVVLHEESEWDLPI